MTDVVGGAQSIFRCFDLLRAVARQGLVGAQLINLSSELNLPHPTVHRLLRALTLQRAIVRDDETRRYHIGPLCFELGLAGNYSNKLVELCKPTLEKLAYDTGDSAYLILRSGSDAVCLWRIDARTRIRAVSLDIGEWRPLGVGAAGVAMLALLSDAERKRIIKDNSKYYKSWKLTTAEVDRRVDQAKNDGIGTSLENFTESISGVGIAIPTISSAPVLGVSVASVTTRVNERRDFIIKKLQSAQAEISRFLKATER